MNKKSNRLKNFIGKYVKTFGYIEIFIGIVYTLIFTIIMTRRLIGLDHLVKEEIAMMVQFYKPGTWHYDFLGEILLEAPLFIILNVLLYPLIKNNGMYESLFFKFITTLSHTKPISLPAVELFIMTWGSFLLVGYLFRKIIKIIWFLLKSMWNTQTKSKNLSTN